MADLEDLKAKASAMPPLPGVYLMKDAQGRIIYVGKAKSLPKRVSSYFQKHPASAKTARMMAKVADLEYLVTDNEKEALLLENSLIKEHRPRYNIILRDDKTYPYLCLTVKDPFPRLEVVRRIQKDGSVYFGPFSSAMSMRQTLRTLRRLFPLRNCRRPEVKTGGRPCLNFQLGRCLGPCRGQVGEAEYRAVVDQVVLFFQGRNQSLADSLRRDMQEAASRLDFEAAARSRDRLAAVERTIERQKMVSTDLMDRDVVGLAHDHGQAMAVLLFIRRGSLLGSRNIPLGEKPEADEDLVESVLSRYYDMDHLVPDEVLLPVRIENRALLEDWLRERRGRAFRLATPVRGPKKKLVDLAVQNAAAALEERLRAADLGADALVEIQKRLGLPAPPRRIEGYDMSTLRGEAPVGALVVLEDGRWIKPDYRRFRIKTASGQDDYAMMSEVLGRRLAREEPARSDLILLDGGRGQIGVALAVIRDLNIQDPPPLAGLAKGRDGEPDRVWLPGRKNPVDFRADSPGLLLLMRVRDEAHRYVQAYHHRVRAKTATRSILDDLPGIGPARRKAILQHFGSLAAARQATAEELAAVKGLGRTAADTVYRFFHPE
ncbi:MAG: excinuclease ABC subunit UvrC [Proteobacteria bacterium]|nr:excinuclease ABC subunit UvrC [Pseudomonadota bacterium]